MKFAILFSLMGAAWVLVAAANGGWAWLLMWPAVAFLIVGAAYARLGPRALGKRADGTIAPWAIVLLFPYLAVAWLAWFLHLMIARPEPSNEVAPGIWIGRRVGAAGLPAGTRMVVDLTSEFPAAGAVRRGEGYVCVPTLDYGATDEVRFRELVRQIAAADGPVYIHCAQGYGRSATVAAAVLIAKGLAADVDEAERLLKSARPRVRLSPAQRELVRRVAGATSDQ